MFVGQVWYPQLASHSYRGVADGFNIFQHDSLYSMAAMNQQSLLYMLLTLSISPSRSVMAS